MLNDQCRPQLLLDIHLHLHHSGIVRKCPVILLILSIFSIGCGGLEYLHNLGHALEDALEDVEQLQMPAAVDLAAVHLAGLHQIPVHSDRHHDESNCPVHAQLHMPAITGGWVPLLVCLGLWIAFLSQRPVPVVRCLHVTRFDSRGPPVSC